MLPRSRCYIWIRGFPDLNSHRQHFPARTCVCARDNASCFGLYCRSAAATFRGCNFRSRDSDNSKRAGKMNGHKRKTLPESAARFDVARRYFRTRKENHMRDIICEYANSDPADPIQRGCCSQGRGNLV